MEYLEVERNVEFFFEMVISEDNMFDYIKEIVILIVLFGFEF